MHTIKETFDHAKGYKPPHVNSAQEVFPLTDPLTKLFPLAKGTIKLKKSCKGRLFDRTNYDLVDIDLQESYQSIHIERIHPEGRVMQQHLLYRVLLHTHC